jgi:hypothetical protein
MGTAEAQRAMDEYQEACLELYRHEQALHDAHQTRVDSWIRAACDRLHDAVVRRERAAALLQELSTSA